MLRKIITQNFSLNSRAILSIRPLQQNKYSFCNEERFISNMFMDHKTEATIRAHRRLHLNKAVLNQNKQVLHGTIRKSTQDIFTLRQQGKCVAYIQRFSGKISQQIDIVLDGKKMRKLTKSPTYGLDQVYIRVQGQEYRCIFERAQMHSHGFIVKAHFKQYIPGKPNKLRIPIQLTHITQNAYLQNSNQFQWIKQEVDVVCYNQQYPKRFYVDISFVSPQRCYRIGDLSNTFCPGLILDSRQDPRSRIIDIKRMTKFQKLVRKQMIKQIIQENKAKAKQKAGSGGSGGAGGDAKAQGAKK